MPKMCEVPYCKEIGAHQFPKNEEVRKMWLKAIRRINFKPEKNSRLCRNHFLETNYQKTSIYTGNEHQHRYLKKSAVPSVFAWTTKAISQEGQAREERLLARNIKKALFEQAHTSAFISRPEDLNFAEELCTQALDIASEQCIQTLDIASDQCPEAENLEELTPVYNYKSVGTQTSVMLKIFSTDLLLTDNESLMFFTGLESYSKFQLVLNTLLPMANSLTYYWSQVIGVSIEDQFLILLIKLRHNKPDYEIAKIFNISKTEVSNIIVTWIHFVHKLWSMIDIWPRRDLVHYYMPQIFKDESSKTRIIIDATEVPIAKPSNPTSQKATYSTYKNTNTMKFLVGSTPGGLLSYCSEDYGGATSDRQMIERSSLLNLCDDGDNIKADRGFNVQDLFAQKNIAGQHTYFLEK